MLRFLSIGAFCFLALGPMNEAAAYTCALENQMPKPSWMASFGQNADAADIFGYAQTRPQAGRALVDITQLLKSRALSDLALNIRSNISSKISSELSVINNSEQDVTRIESAAETSLSLNAVSDTQIHIDEQACMIFARVSLRRADLPYILALSDFQQFAAQLNFHSASQDDLSRFSALLDGLTKAETAATAFARAQHASLQGDIERVSNLARDREIELMTEQLATLAGTPKEKRQFAGRLLSLLQDKGDDISPSQAESKNQAEQVLAEINALMGSARIAVGWQTDNAALDEALVAFFDIRQESFWHTEQGSDINELSDIMRAYELETSLFIKPTTKTTRKFGIDEVDINIELTYIFDKEPTNTKQMTTQAIGRPINDRAIADKIISTLAQQL